jgi:hypothetical protein
MKYPTLVARQLAINQRIGTGTTSELVSYLALDKKNPSTGNTLRQILMEIPSSSHEGVPVFHSIDRQWRSENYITFTFLPDNESDGRMYIAGLIPFLRASSDSWFLQFFSEEAKYNHHHNVWDPSTRQIFSTDEADINSFLCEDDAQNLSDEPTAMKASNVVSMNSEVEFCVPDVEATSGKPAMYEDDSVSTFRSHAKGLLSSGSDRLSVSFSQPIVIDEGAQAPVGGSQPIPSAVHEDSKEDGSVSRMSDSMTKILVGGSI